MDNMSGPGAFDDEPPPEPRDGWLLVRIHVPELNVYKCLQFPSERLVWDVKQQVLASLPKVSTQSSTYHNPFRITLCGSVYIAPVACVCHATRMTLKTVNRVQNGRIWYAPESQKKNFWKTKKYLEHVNNLFLILHQIVLYILHQSWISKSKGIGLQLNPRGQPGVD